MLDQQPAGRVAEARQHDRGAAEQSPQRAAEVEAEQHDHPGEAEKDPREPQARRPLLVVEPDRENDRPDRRRRDEDPGQRRGDLLLAGGD